MDYDYNKNKSSDISIERLRKLKELMGIYGPLNEYGYPNKVTSINANNYSKEIETRKKAIENICDYVRNQFAEYDVEALRNERTKVLKEVSSIIEEAKKRAKKAKKPLSLTEEEKNMVMAYAIKKQEETYYLNSDEYESYSDEEFFSAEEVLIAYGGEGPRALSKRLGTKINIVK